MLFKALHIYTVLGKSWNISHSLYLVFFFTDACRKKFHWMEWKREWCVIGKFIKNYDDLGAVWL